MNLRPSQVKQKFLLLIVKILFKKNTIFQWKQIWVTKFKKKIRIFHVHFRKKFAEKKYMKDRFLNQESNWLNNYVLNDELNDIDQSENCVEKKLPQSSRTN